MKKYLLLALICLLSPSLAKAAPTLIYPVEGHWSGHYGSGASAVKITFEVDAYGNVKNFKIGKHFKGINCEVSDADGHAAHFRFNHRSNPQELPYLGHGTFSNYNLYTGRKQSHGYIKCAGDLRIYKNHHDQENDYHHWSASWHPYTND
jgi:hypothetical protein